MRYEMTARENIAVGKIEEVDDFSRLQDAGAEEHGRRSDRHVFRESTIRCSAVASKVASIFPAASGKRSLWPAPICGIPKC